MNRYNRALRAFSLPYPYRNALRSALLLLFRFTFVTANSAQAEGGEAGLVIGDVGKLVEKYAPEVALQASKVLPTIIDDAASKERARKILNASAANLPGAGFLQISANGTCRLYVINDQNVMMSTSATTITEMLGSQSLRALKTVIVDDLSAQIYRSQLASVQSQFALYTVAGIEPITRMTFGKTIDRKINSTPSASAILPRDPDDRAWTAADVFIFAVISLVTIIGARRFYGDFMRGYRGKT